MEKLFLDDDRTVDMIYGKSMEAEIDFVRHLNAQNKIYLIWRFYILKRIMSLSTFSRRLINWTVRQEKNKES